MAETPTEYELLERCKTLSDDFLGLPSLPEGHKVVVDCHGVVHVDTHSSVYRTFMSFVLTGYTKKDIVDKLYTHETELEEVVSCFRRRLMTPYVLNNFRIYNILPPHIVYYIIHIRSLLQGVTHAIVFIEQLVYTYGDNIPIVENLTCLVHRLSSHRTHIEEMTRSLTTDDDTVLGEYRMTETETS